MDYVSVLTGIQEEYSITLTHHAWQRMSGRGIAPAEMDTVIEFGRELHVRGAVVYSVGKLEVAEARRLTGRDVRHLEGCHVVCTVDGIVLTTYKNRDFRKLRDRRVRSKRHDRA